MCGKVPPSVQVRMQAASIAAQMLCTAKQPVLIDQVTQASFEQVFGAVHKVLLGTVTEPDMDKAAPNEVAVAMRADATARHAQARAEASRANFLTLHPDAALSARSGEATHLLQKHCGHSIGRLCRMTVWNLQAHCTAPEPVIEIQEALQRHGLGLSMTKDQLNYWVNHGRREIDATPGQPEEETPRDSAEQ